MEEEKLYIPPDYTGHPGEDDEEDSSFDEMVDEDEIRIEKLLDEQEKLNQKLSEDEEDDIREERRWTPMSSSPFDNSTPSFGGGGSTKKPWETEERSSTPTWRGGSEWSGASSWNRSTPSFGAKREEERPVKTPTSGGGGMKKKVVICDVLDCLYESWESNNRPNILPRAIFDLKPKFTVWDRIASFNPQRLYIIFPANEIVPSFGNRRIADLTLEYIKACISTYLRIPNNSVVILKQQIEGAPKERVLFSAARDWKRAEDMVYIGICTGRWGLSSRDADAAHACGIDYIDMYNLLDGKYEYE